MTHDDIKKAYLENVQYREGWMYPEENYHHVNEKPTDEFLSRDHQREIFFPKCSSSNAMAYECLPKTVN